MPAFIKADMLNKNEGTTITELFAAQKDWVSVNKKESPFCHSMESVEEFSSISLTIDYVAFEFEYFLHKPIK